MTRSIFHDLICDNLEAILSFYTITILNRYHLKSQLNEKTIPTQNTNKFGFVRSCRKNNRQQQVSLKILGIQRESSHYYSLCTLILQIQPCLNSMQGMLYRQKPLVPGPPPAESCTGFIPDRVTFSWLTLAPVLEVHFPLFSLHS